MGEVMSLTPHYHKTRVDDIIKKPTHILDMWLVSFSTSIIKKLINIKNKEYFEYVNQKKIGIYIHTNHIIHQTGKV